MLKPVNRAFLLVGGCRKKIAAIIVAKLVPAHKPLFMVAADESLNSVTWRLEVSCVCFFLLKSMLKNDKKSQGASHDKLQTSTDNLIYYLKRD